MRKERQAVRCQVPKGFPRRCLDFNRKQVESLKEFEEEDEGSGVTIRFLMPAGLRGGD